MEFVVSTFEPHNKRHTHARKANNAVDKKKNVRRHSRRCVSQRAQYVASERIERRQCQYVNQMYHGD